MACEIVLTIKIKTKEKGLENQIKITFKSLNYKLLLLVLALLLYNA